jgi:four helix bundle protein
MKDSISRIKSEAFAIRIIKLYNYLCDKRREFVLSKQILRSGTSIGANLAEADFAISKADFLSKIYISIKECSETLYWLRLLKETKYLTEKEFSGIYFDCEELIKILTSSIKTVKINLEKTKC